MIATRLAGHLPDRHVLVEDGYRPLRHRRELEVEQLAGDEEHRLAQLVELQVLLDLVGVEVVLGLAHLLGVVAVVPGLDGDARPFGVGDRLHVGDLFCDAGDRRRPDGLHQLERPLRRLGHAILQPPVGVVLVAQELDALVPEGQDLGDQGVVVVLVTVVTARVVAPPDLLP